MSADGGTIPKIVAIAAIGSGRTLSMQVFFTATVVIFTVTDLKQRIY
jgi:hypothetical protein